MAETNLINFTKEQINEYHIFATEIAKEAGDIITRACGQSKNIESKQSYADLVTETDKTVEEFIKSQLKQKYPSHKFIGEETVALTGHRGVDVSNDPTWIIDPVDGTMNFVHTFPYVAVCIGLTINQKTVLGIVYCPALNQLYSAQLGCGAFCNNQRIKIRCSNSLEDSLVCTEVGSGRDAKKREAVFKNLESVGWQSHGIRSLGSAAMNICSVASGHTNAFYEFGIHCWDMCAAGIILLEAGGYLCDTTGETFDLFQRRIIAACSEKIGQNLAKALVVQLDLGRD